MSTSALQVSLPSGPVAPMPADGKSVARPLAGPVVPLTVTPENSEELLGGAGGGSTHGDAIATKVLVKGEPVAAPPGRADALAWPRGGETIVDKYGGMNNASVYIGLIPERKVGVVILGNRGSMALSEVGRGIILSLARG